MVTIQELLKTSDPCVMKNEVEVLFTFYCRLVLHFKGVQYRSFWREVTVKLCFSSLESQWKF